MDTRGDRLTGGLADADGGAPIRYTRSRPGQPRAHLLGPAQATTR